MRWKLPSRPLIFILSLLAFLAWAYLFLLRTVSGVLSAGTPQVVRIPAPVSREVHVFEFYDNRKTGDRSQEKELDALASDFGSYDRRTRVDLSSLHGLKIAGEFGITETPAVVVTNSNRDFKLVFTGPKIASRLRASIESNGYKSVKQSGFG